MHYELAISGSSTSGFAERAGDWEKHTLWGTMLRGLTSLAERTAATVVLDNMTKNKEVPKKVVIGSALARTVPPIYQINSGDNTGFAWSINSCRRRRFASKTN